MKSLLAHVVAVLALASGGQAAEPDAVIVLHGLGRTDRSMSPLASRLTEAGFRVHNMRYPSTDEEPAALIAQLGLRVAQCCDSAPRLHFVGHSLGGLITRAFLAESEPENLGRVVMIAPPNHGSQIVDAFGDSALFEWVLGPTASQLGTDPDDFPQSLPPPRYELGVIAGDASMNPVGSSMLPGEDDGAVTVESAKLSGMTDFVTVPYTHTFIMRSEDVARLTIHFLRHGRFHSPAGERGDEAQ